jgi:hypothetical protein
LAGSLPGYIANRVSILSSRNPRAKLVAICAVAIPGAALLGYVAGGTGTAIGAAATAFVLMIASAVFLRFTERAKPTARP